MKEPRHSERGLLITEIVLEYFRTNGRLIAWGDAITKDIGLTSARWQVMAAIAAMPHDVTVSIIARLMGLQRQSVQRVVDLLAADKYVELEENPHHKKAKVVKLTPAGAQLYKEVMRREIKWANSIAISLKEHDLEAILKFMRHLRAKIGDAGPTIPPAAPSAPERRKPR
ncbi:MAG TPA: MarR family transcriptional regulator [Povalibacter sp.]|uniref:MarR family winged helix-turn-helix transcriptional regulator n=1 Tax=Povalibacter sp. TaxID=1962978 RepID=UPI002C9EAC88|nr:MarR family transcriptional regulator [Povalibacter sp.]HMN43798.1 MarR family transcriptional regulator [Povalibacter sp.]